MNPLAPLQGVIDATVGEIDVVRQYPELRAQIKAKHDRDFWIPLYQSVCQMSLEQYNDAAQAFQPKIEMIVEAYGSDFAPVWYHSGSGQGVPTATITEDEYARRRNELGCPMVAPKPRWGFLVAGGVVLVAGTAGIYWLIQRSKKPARKKRKKR